MGSGITVAIPTITTRKPLLGRALASVFNQTLLPDSVAVAVDIDHDGVWVTRARAATMADTPWVAFLDDDDEFLPQHLERLLACAVAEQADLVYSCFETVPSGRDVLGLCGHPFNPKHPPTTVTGTVLVTRTIATLVKYGPPGEGWRNAQDDHFLLHGALALGAKVVHLPEVTWLYHHHGVHTSGQPSRW
jgi:glycosyltransferase involved in cell wall biosynthesis